MLDKTPLRVWSTGWKTSFSKIRTRRTKQTCLGKEAFAPPPPKKKPGVWVGVFHRDHQTLILSKTMIAHLANTVSNVKWFITSRRKRLSVAAENISFSIFISLKKKNRQHLTLQLSTILLQC